MEMPNPIQSSPNRTDRLLLPLVQWLPRWVSPNALSAVRALCIIPIYLAYRQGAYTTMLLLVVLALVTDALDGLQARRIGDVSTSGKLIDPAADKILFGGVLLMIGPDRLSPTVIITIVTLEIMLVLLATVVGPLFARLLHLRPVLGANAAGKIKMALEATAMSILLVGLSSPIAQNIAEGILWAACAAAATSIMLHLTSREPHA